MSKNPRSGHSVAYNKRWLVLLLCAILLWLISLNVPALAHKVTIFAWVEGDTVYTQSKFSGGRKAKNSAVVVYDKEGNLLLKGKTDDKGEFSFKVPKKTDLKVALEASMGHLAEWTIPADKITEVADVYESKPPEDGVEASTEEVAPSMDTRNLSEPRVSATAGLSRQEVKALIDESLDRKLAPIRNMLASALDNGPSTTQVIGGIGYIFGLVGVALYFSRRRKND